MEPIRLFKSQKAWAEWLNKNHRQSEGLWLRHAKKGSTIQSVSYQEAIEVALCYGWIDGQKKPENDQTWLQKFSPRSSMAMNCSILRARVAAVLTV